MLNRTPFGLHALAVGGREEAARVVGLPIARIKFLVYALTGALAGLGGVVVAARLSNGSPNAGQMMELDVIAAVVLGGTSLFGGSATMLGTIIGALLLNFIRNGLNLMNVNPFWVQVVTGVVLIAAVLINTLVNRNLEAWRVPWTRPTNDRPLVEDARIGQGATARPGAASCELTLAPGEVLGLVGDNAAGKSTR